MGALDRTLILARFENPLRRPKEVPKDPVPASKTWNLLPSAEASRVGLVAPWFAKRAGAAAEFQDAGWALPTIRESMNWDAIGAIGEIVGALAVVITLFYLARQVRQNTTALKANANQALLDSYDSVMAAPRESEYGARIYQAALSDELSGLSVAELAGIRAVIIRVVRVFEQAWIRRQAGMFSDAAWEGWVHHMRTLLGTHGFARGWRALRPMMNAEFAEWVDELHRGAPELTAEYVLRWYEDQPEILQLFFPPDETTL